MTRTSARSWSAGSGGKLRSLSLATSSASGVRWSRRRRVQAPSTAVGVVVGPEDEAGDRRGLDPRARPLPRPPAPRPAPGRPRPPAAPLGDPAGPVVAALDRAGAVAVEREPGGRGLEPVGGAALGAEVEGPRGHGETDRRVVEAQGERGARGAAGVGPVGHTVDVELTHAALALGARLARGLGDAGAPEVLGAGVGTVLDAVVTAALGLEVLGVARRVFVDELLVLTGRDEEGEGEEGERAAGHATLPKRSTCRREIVE